MHNRIAAAVLFVGGLSIASPAQDEAAFDQAYAGVRDAMQKGKWQDAKKAIDALLAQNEKQLYVLAAKDAIVADAMLCAFWLQAAMPKPEELVTGKIESYAPKEGRIKVRYARDAMGDWGEEAGLLVHPAVFAGNYTITISGRSYPVDDTIRCVVDMTGDSFFVVDLGLGSRSGGRAHMAVRRGGGSGKPVTVTECESPTLSGAAFSAQIKVSKRAIEVSYDKEPMLKADRRGDALGQFAMVKGEFGEVTIEGSIEPSWFQGLVDQKLSEQRADFEARFRPQSVLPAWLFEAPTVKRTPQKDLYTSRVAKTRAGREVFALLARGDVDKALAQLQGLGDKDLEAGDRAFLFGICHLRRGDPEAALPFAEQALTAQPEAAHSRVLKARVLDELRRSSEAIPLLQQAIADDPGDYEATEALFVLLMQHNDVTGADRLVRDAKCKHGMWSEVKELDAMLAMRARGPAWHRRFSSKSPHYEVFSDIDARVCMRATQLLESAYVNLKGQLAWLKEDKDLPRFQVYLFAGEGGYQEYNAQILGAPKPHTAGLYSPVLKQLLIWNVPKREDMERTIRHEGFHQFLDRAMEDPPVWFNEGMAEFWETARREDSSLQGGQVRKDHIATLLRSKNLLLPLGEFVHGSRADFYANAQVRYAEGWALVHFLRKGDAARQKLWKGLWDALRAPGCSSRQAVDKAFEGVDWQKFEADFWRYLANLDRK